MTTVPQELLRKNIYLLLFGLLDDKEAEDLRTQLATDSDAAAVFDKARANFELFRDAVRESSQSDSIDERVVSNVSVESRVSSPFAFDAAVGSFEEGVFSEETKIDEESLVENASSSKKQRRLDKKRKEKRRSRKEKEQVKSTVLTQDRRANSRWGGAVVDGLTEFFKAIDGGVCRFFQLLGRSPLFCGLFITLCVLGCVVALGGLRQDRLLSRYFFDDFRMQVAVPRTLVRGSEQTVVVRTTGVDGRARRVPVRFCFSNPTTGELIHAHTESGNSDGTLVYEIPELKSFSDTVELSVCAGTNETESFKTRIDIVSPEDLRVDRHIGWTAPGSEPDVSSSSSLLSPAFVDAISFLGTNDSRSVSNEDDTLNDVLPEEVNSNSVERVFIRFYPETGSLTADVVNHVGVFCSDKDGRPLAKRLALFQNDVTEPISVFSTSSSGFGAFDWAPAEDANFAIVQTSGNENEGVVENPFVTGHSLGVLNDPNGLLSEYPPTVEIDPASGQDYALFNPPVVRKPAYLTLNSRTPNVTDSLSIKLNVFENVPLIMTVDKNGTTVWQRFLTSVSYKNPVELALPDSLSGLLRFSLYSVAQGKFQKVSETIVFRNPISSSIPVISAEIVKTTTDSGNKELAIRASDREEKKNLVDSFWDEKPVRLRVFWTADRKKLISSLDADDVLANIPETTREEIVKTASASKSFNPPIVFDNCDSLVKDVQTKLEMFKEDDAKSFMWTVRLVFVSCIAIAIASLFLAIFRAFSMWKCFMLGGLAGLLLWYANGLQHTLDAVFKNSRDIVFAIDEEEFRRSNWDSSDSRSEESSFDRDSLEQEGDLSEVKLVTSRELEKGTTEIPLSGLLQEEELSTGYLLLRIENGRFRHEVVVSLEDDGELETVE